MLKSSLGGKKITQQSAHLAAADQSIQPRAIGRLKITSKARDGLSVIDTLHQSGALRALFPTGNGMSATIINTAGGITGGDRLDVAATAGANSHLTLTTQAAERAYRATGTSPGRLSTTLKVGANATLHWLPQELILFDGAHFDRRLRIDLEQDASLLMVEPIVFGRTAMGETLKSMQFLDQIYIRRDGAPIYIDGLSLKGDVSAQLAQPSMAAKAAAIASVLLVRSDAEAMLPKIRAMLPQTAGASLLAPDILSVRFVAIDSFLLRKHLIPTLDILRGAPLPPSWRL